MRPKGIDWSAERVVYWTAAVAPHVALAIWLVGLAVFGYRVATTPPSEPAPAPTTGDVVVYSAGYGSITRTNGFTYDVR